MQVSLDNEKTFDVFLTSLFLVVPFYQNSSILQKMYIQKCAYKFLVPRYYSYIVVSFYKLLISQIKHDINLRMNEGDIPFDVERG